jgi:hypothetical protein
MGASGIGCPTVMNDTGVIRTHTAEFRVLERIRSENDPKVRNLHPAKASAAKRKRQGIYMRELHKLNLPRPITTVVLHVHVELTRPNTRERDPDNFYRQAMKPLLDALVGPKFHGTGKNQRPANRAMIVDGARYVGGWLVADSQEHVRSTVSFCDTPGPYSTLVRLEWD